MIEEPHGRLVDALGIEASEQSEQLLFNSLPLHTQVNRSHADNVAIVEREAMVEGVPIGWIEQHAFDSLPARHSGLVGEVGIELVEVA